MSDAVKGSFLRFCVALLIASLVGQTLAALSRSEEEMMEDMCDGDMVWMIGWCLDMVMPGDAVDVAALAPNAAAASSAEFQSINMPPEFGASATRAFGINPQGDIVGSYTAGGRTRGFVLHNGTFTTIEVSLPGVTVTSTEAWGINARGDIVGRYTIAGRAGVLGFLLRKGVYSDVSIPSATRADGKHLTTLPTKIGASGETVGCFHDASTLIDMFGYVQRDSEVISTFALPSAVGPAAAMHNGIDPGGNTVVGFVNAPGRARGYILRNNEVTYLDGPGSTGTQAWDVSTTGTVVGNYDAGGRTHGFYYVDGTFVTLDVQNSSMTVARGINPRGEIVGVYNDSSGTHGFVVRP